MSRGIKVLLVTSIGVYLVALDVSILNVAFRNLVADFGPQNRTLLTWVFSGYNIAFAAALMTAGRAADRFGRKRAFLTGLLVFVVGSIGCGLAPSAGFLVGARVVQALGGALIMPSSLALVLPEFPLAKRSAAIGIWGAVGGIAAATGPTIGGLLVDASSWRLVFFVNIPLSLLAFGVGVRLLRETRDESATGVPDILGALLATAGVGLLTLAIVQGEEWGWSSARILGSQVASVVLLTAFVAQCRRHRAPVLDLALLRLRFFTAANLATFFFSLGFFAMFFTNIQYLQGVWDYSVIRSGLAMTPGPAMAALFAAPAGRLAHRYGHRRVIGPGAGLFALGIILLALLADTSPAYLTVYLPVMLITGTGVGLTISTLSSASNAYLPGNRFAMGSAFNTTCRQVGAALGIAIVTALRTSASETEVMEGFRWSWYFIAATTGLAAVAMFLVFRKPSAADVAAANTAERKPDAALPATAAGG
jgi:EmrB/QacA subfamily drug resistance transporter